MKPNESKTAEIYPCADCGKLRSIDQGASVFTVCDACWDKKHKSKTAMTEKGIRVWIDTDDGEVRSFTDNLVCNGYAFTDQQLAELKQEIRSEVLDEVLKLAEIASESTQPDDEDWPVVMIQDLKIIIKSLKHESKKDGQDGSK